MSREVKRVDFGFDWYERTMDKDGSAKDWFGYLLPVTNCKLCAGTGKNLKGVSCPLCYGDGKISPTIEPPEGDGWQLWQDVSEGSPVSPVFKTPLQLARWLAKHDTSIHNTGDYQDWLAMIKDGWCPSGVSMGHGLMSGVAAARKKNEVEK